MIRSLRALLTKFAVRRPTSLKKEEVVALVVFAVAVLIAARSAHGAHDEFQWLPKLLLLTCVGAFAMIITRWKLPDVLGCLVIGCFIANVFPETSKHIAEDHVVTGLGGLGILVLLFNAGLESSVGKLMTAGPIAMRVAVVGVILPLVLGGGLCLLLFDDVSVPQVIFFGSALTATSVGITMKVLTERGLQCSREGQIILAAAVIDDVLGLMVLAVNQQLAAGGDSLSLALGAVKIFVVAAGFFAVVMAFGERVSKFLARQAARLGNDPKIKISFAVAWMLFMSWVASLLHLEPILGAFAAGLVLNEEHFLHFGGEVDKPEEVMESIAAVTVPVFFVLVGMKISFTGFTSYIAFGSVLVGAVAVVGKVLAGHKRVTGDDALDAKLIGVGMVPRGEVGIVFANIGLSSEVLTRDMFTSLILVIAATTGIAIVWLAWMKLKTKVETT